MNVYQAAQSLKLNFFIYRGYVLGGGITYFTLAGVKDQIQHYYKYTKPALDKEKELLSQGYVRYNRF